MVSYFTAVRSYLLDLTGMDPLKFHVEDVEDAWSLISNENFLLKMPCFSSRGLSPSANSLSNASRQTFADVKITAGI